MTTCIQRQCVFNSVTSEWQYIVLLIMTATIQRPLFMGPLTPGFTVKRNVGAVYVCVCVRMYVCVCMYVCMCVCMYVCVCVYWNQQPIITKAPPLCTPWGQTNVVINNHVPCTEACPVMCEISAVKQLILTCVWISSSKDELRYVGGRDVIVWHDWT